MFCTSGTLSPIDPGLEVVGVGPVRLPLKPAMAKSLIAAARIAPFGKGTETLVDTKVRKTFEIDASQIQLSATSEKTIDEVVSRVATDLGLTDLQLRAEPYKVLLYERGGHFQRHRDSEKIDRMVGSLIVMLPSGFSGGELVIRHEGARETFSFEAARSESTPNYVAFYADCEHEVLRVDTGRRLPTSVDATGAVWGVVQKPSRMTIPLELKIPVDARRRQRLLPRWGQSRRATSASAPSR
jgi:predicted 2-oxoglutarate/Fe(II)-dependent dioxygenase YbiX